MGRLEDTLYMIFQILPKSFLVTACVFWGWRPLFRVLNKLRFGGALGLEV